MFEFLNYTSLLDGFVLWYFCLYPKNNWHTCCSSQKHDSEEDLDWWSKYYASTGDLAKSGNYLEKGYDKIKVNIKLLLVFSSDCITAEGCSLSKCILLFRSIQVNWKNARSLRDLKILFRLSQSVEARIEQERTLTNK